MDGDFIRFPEPPVKQQFSAANAKPPGGEPPAGADEPRNRSTRLLIVLSDWGEFLWADQRFLVSPDGLSCGKIGIRNGDMVGELS